ncbi:MAG TPA: glycoside hydrolase family 36 protein [Terriglobia bacterium]|nr:glycoside hydrolase family 36 protein [Terriglobia bacterium]
MTRSRRIFFLAFVLASGMFAGARLLLEALPQASQRAHRQTRTTASPAKPTVTGSAHWVATLARDRRTIALAYGGATWVTGLRIEVTAGNPKFSSTAPGNTLGPVRSRQKDQWIFKVHGPAAYEIVLSGEGPALDVSLSGFPPGGEAQAEIAAEIDGGREPIQARLRDPDDGVQQMTSGPATSTLNDCVYDRFRDQALQILARKTGFSVAANGFRVSAADPLSAAPHCRFRVVEHVLGSRLPFYAPLDKSKWPEVPVGWISWYQYFSRVTEQDIVENAQAVAKYFKAFGLKYCLVDAGWQAAGDGEKGSPIGGDWNAWNDKFPHGMKWLADQIHSQGLYAGLWLSAFGNADAQFYEIHPDWFLHEASGSGKLGTWFGTYVADFSNPALKKYLYDTYRDHALNWGYDYFKLDGENATRDIWAENRDRAYDPSMDANTAFRQALGVIHDAMDSKPGVFFSACGPAFPTEAMGIAQAGRLAGDVVGDGEPPSFRGVREALAGIRRGYYTHGIAWYGDPDALVVRPPLTREEARTWTSILGLTGQVLMLGDDETKLSPERRDMVRKIMPVADITPMDLYPFDSDRPVWILHVKRRFGSWAVAGLFNWGEGPDEMPVGMQAGALRILTRDDRLLGTSHEYGEQLAISSKLKYAEKQNQSLAIASVKAPGLQLLPVPSYLNPPAPRKTTLNFAKAGLEAGRDYLLFDFWKQKFLGKVRGEYSVDLAPHDCQVVSIRPDAGHPQLIGTDRHITMGGVEIANELWDSARKQLRIRVSLVQNYPTTLTIYSGGVSLKSQRAAAARITALAREGETVRVTLVRPNSGDAELVLTF